VGSVARQHCGGRPLPPQSGLGVRQGEAFGLSLAQVDFLPRQVSIGRQLVRLARGLEIAPPKTQRSIRTVRLPAWVADELALHIQRWPSKDPDGLLFESAWGCRLRRDGCNRRYWKPAAAMAGRPKLTFHALRHFLRQRTDPGGPVTGGRRAAPRKLASDGDGHLRPPVA
jgi:integrase